MKSDKHQIECYTEQNTGTYLPTIVWEKKQLGKNNIKKMRLTQEVTSLMKNGNNFNKDLQQSNTKSIEIQQKNDYILPSILAPPERTIRSVSADALRTMFCP